MSTTNNVYHTADDFDKAIEYYQGCLNIHRMEGNKLGEAADLGSIGSIYYAKGNLDKSVKYYQKALIIHREAGDRQSEAIDLNSIGNAYHAKGDIDKAFQYHQEALMTLEETVKYYQEALIIHREMGDKLGEATDLGNIGNVYYAKGDLDKALNCYQEALVIHRAERNWQGEIPDLGNISNIYYARGDFDKALEYQRKMQLIKDQEYVIHLPYHLVLAEMSNELCELLTEFEFLEYKLSIVEAQELVDDYDFTLRTNLQLSPENRNILKLIQRALELSMHVLNKDKTQLAGQLVGRLSLYEFPMIKELIKQAGTPKTFPWFCPLGAVLSSPEASLIKSLVAHTEGIGGVNSILLIEDGGRLISAGHNIKIWDINSGKLLQTLYGHSQSINSMALTPNNKHLVSASDDETLKVWDLDNGREIMTLEKHGCPVSAVVITPDGHHAISAARFSGSHAENYEPHDNPLIVWCLETGKKVMSLHGHLHSVVALAITPAGHHVISAEGANLGEDSIVKSYVVKVWDLKNGREQMTLYDQPSPIKTVKVTPDGLFIIAAIDSETGVPSPIQGPTRSGILKVWDLKNGSERFTLSSNAFEDLGPDIYRNGVLDFTFFSERKLLVSVDEDHQIRLWDMENGVEFNSFFLHWDGHFRNLVITPDEKYLIIALNDGTIKFWDWLQLNNSKSIEFQDNTLGTVTSITITLDGEKAISSSNRTLKVWDIGNRKILFFLNGHEASIDVVAAMPDNQHVISVSEDQVIKIWDVRNGKETLTFVVPPPLRYFPSLSGLPITPDGQYAVTPVSVFNDKDSITENLFIVWNLDTGKEHLRIPVKLEFPMVNATVVTPDGKCVIAHALSGESILVVKIDTGEILSILNVSRSVDGLAVTPDGKRLITSQDGGLTVWDLANRTELFTLADPSNGMMKQREFVIDPSGHYLYSIGSTSSGLDRNNLEVFNLYSGELIASFKADNSLCSIAVAPNGVIVAAGTSLSQVHFLELKEVEKYEY
jgi:WD40 repeat protein/tetratricopeptide (TPR) repeat protein